MKGVAKLRWAGGGGAAPLLRVDKPKRGGAETHQFLYIYYFLMWKPLSSPLFHVRIIFGLSLR
jgi:hypothetical protein